MKITLVCNAGMSTSMLVQRMQKAAKEKNMEVEIIAVPVTAIKPDTDCDIIMLGPQVRHQMKSVQNIVNNIPVAVIDMRAYGTMDGKKVLEDAIKIIEANQ